MAQNNLDRMLRWAYLRECLAPADGWKVMPFNDVAKIVAGQSPPSDTYNDKEIGLPFLQGNADFGFMHPSPVLWCSAPAKKALTGDTLFSVRAPVGEINRADCEYAIGRGLAAVRAAGSQPDFIYHALHRWRWCLQRVAQGTTFDAITARHFSKLFVAVPSVPEEQAAIAVILDAADAVTERARAALVNAKRLRRALMQKLLPPWVGLHDLPIEQMPKDVNEIVRASLVADICNGSTPSRTEGRYWHRGIIPWLPTGKVHDRVISQSNEFVTDTALRECSIGILPRGTVLVAMIGQGRTRGMSAYLDIEACINQNFGAFAPKSKLCGKWLFYYFDFHYSRLREIGGGTNQGALNCYLLKRIRIPLQLEERQIEVVAVLDAVEALVKARQRALENLGVLKKSLMHDLLTGRVRVNKLMQQLEAAKL